MRKLTEKEMHDYLLEIVRALDNYCKANNIVYYLSGGSLLGAVRHNGFIPWDDDIDVMMPRDDYERFVSGFVDDRYKLAYCEKNKEFGYPYAQMWDSRTIKDWGNLNQLDIGLCIDILPIDGYSDSLLLSKIREYHLLLIRKFRVFMMQKEMDQNVKFRLIKNFIYKNNPKSANDYAVLINKMGRQHSFQTSKYVGVQSGTYHAQKERNPKSIFDNTVFLKFEDMMLPAPEGYDVYLRHLYGDYMTPPPVEQQVGRHTQDVYLKED